MSHNYLKDPSRFGHQPPHRASKTGRPLFHALGCRADGGPGLPPHACLKCGDDIADARIRLLMRMGERARS